MHVVSLLSAPSVPRLTTGLVSRPKPLNRLVITTVVLLFLTNAVNCGVQWYLGKVALIQHPSSEVAIFIGFYESPQSMWSSYVETVCYFVAAALADGLLVRMTRVSSTEADILVSLVFNRYGVAFISGIVRLGLSYCLRCCSLQSLVSHGLEL